MTRSLVELAAYAATAVLLAAVALSPAPITAASSAGSTSASRGQQLFAPKGCIGCHTHADVPGARMQVGPDLTALAARAGARVSGLSAGAYVRQSLRDPSAFVVPGYATVAMPDLQLADDEIGSLTAFLLDDY